MRQPRTNPTPRKNDTSKVAHVLEVLNAWVNEHRDEEWKSDTGVNRM